MEKDYIDRIFGEGAFTHLYISSIIDERLFDEVSLRIDDIFPQRMVLTLVDKGGCIHEAYRLAQLLQAAFPHLAVHVPARASAPGTLIACAGSVLVINQASTLCPLDMPSNPGQAAAGVVVNEMQGSIFDPLRRQSATLQAAIAQQLVDHTQGGLGYDSAAKFAGEATVGLMSGIYAQFLLEKMTAHQQSLQTVKRYAENLADRGGNLLDGAISRLVYGYPSPDYLIGSAEVGGIFSRISGVGRELGTALARSERYPFVRPGRYPFSLQPSTERIVDIEILRGEPFTDPYKVEAEPKHEDRNVRYHDEVQKG